MDNNSKIIKKHCEELSSFIKIKSNTKVAADKKRRLGFYHLVLQFITGERDIDSINEIIQDTEFRSLVFNERVNDMGVDAVYINDAEAKIQLFSFKYHEGKRTNSKMDGGIIDRSKKFLDLLYEENDFVKNDNSIVSHNINKINQILETQNYILELYCVSNLPKGFDERENDTIKMFEDKYSISIIEITQEEILNWIGTPKVDSNCKIIIKGGDYFKWKSTIVCKIPLYDLVRITSSSKSLRNNINCASIDLNNIEFENSLINDNVRGYLKKSKYNTNLINSIKNEWNNFFIYNNGVTFTCSNASIDKVPKKIIISIKNFQIVNGGQTIRSIYEYIKMNDSEYEKKLKSSFVLLKIVITDSISTDRITEYTNTQNPISKINLKSNNIIQIQIEKFLSSKGILYVRKAGEISNVRGLKRRITMECFTQILYASQGYPERVSNQKIKLFDEYYDDIYNNSKFELEISEKLIDKYDKIKDYYHKNNKYKFANQKIFYIIYLLNFYSRLDIPAAVKVLEKAIKQNKKYKRPMLQSDFKEDLRKLIDKSN